MSRSPGRFTHRGVNASGSCSGERGNVLAVGTYCCVAVCILQARSARRPEALRRPQREERGGGILRRPPAYSLLVEYVTGKVNFTFIKFKGLWHTAGLSNVPRSVGTSYAICWVNALNLMSP